MKTFNKRGDGGETSLLYGGRVAKSHPRCEAYGAVDEAVSALGLARALARRKRVKEVVYGVQQELFTVGAEMATANEEDRDTPRRLFTVTEEMTQRVEGLIDELEAEIEMPRAFIIPGASSGSAALDLARTIIRRAERLAVNLQRDGLIRNESLLGYLNRLADLVFTLARYEEYEEEAE